MAGSIHSDTTLGYVHLTVADLDRSSAFYQDVMGFKIHRRRNGSAHLGAGKADLLVLTERPGARRARGSTGLYHLAVLAPSRLELARSLQRLEESGWPLQGFADHWVSEAIYLADPDGSGIEIYRDRPRSEWPRRNGQLQMAVDPLDVEGVLSELSGRDEPWTGLHPATRVGHVHLHVAHLEPARAFYCDVLGFDLVMNYGASAAFVSAGGYHHHVGLNTWAGVGAPPPPPDSVGLRHFVVRLPNPAELGKAADRVRNAGLQLEEQEEGLLVRDPSQNGIVLTAENEKD